MWTLQYLRDYQTFVGTARYWTETFAKASSLGVEEKVWGTLSFHEFIGTLGNMFLLYVFSIFMNEKVLKISEFHSLYLAWQYLFLIYFFLELYICDG